MPSHILALGESGARMAEACLMQAMAGHFPTAHVVLMAASEERGKRLRELYDRYALVHRHSGSQPGPFSAELTLTVWPEETARASIGEQASSSIDRLVCRALFTQEQASLSPAHALDTSGSVAAMTWATCLSQGDPVLHRLVEDAALGARIVLLSGLSDPSGASGTLAIASYIKRLTDAVPAAVLQLPVHRDEDVGLARSMLLSGRLEELLGDTCLLGMPEDCRRPGDGPHLADWLAAIMARELLEGKHGSFSWRVPAEDLRWEAFGEEADALRKDCTALARSAAMLLTAYGDPLEAALQDQASLKKLSGWYKLFFSDVKHLEDEERRRLLEGLQAWRRSMESWCGWMYRLLDDLPPVLRWAEELSQVREEASEHYEQVLTAAGQLAFLLYDMEKSGMAQDTFIHRRDMEDNETEAALKQIESLRDRLSSLIADQEALFHKLGGRLTRAVLQQFSDREEAAANEMRVQAEEVRRKIDHAAEIAAGDELGKVATARIRLARMERHVALLNGRATRARRDLTSWRKEDRRSLMPTVEGSGEHAVLILPADALHAIAYREAKALNADWPWPEKTARQLKESLEHGGTAAAPDCLGKFLRSLWSACG